MCAASLGGESLWAAAAVALCLIFTPIYPFLILFFFLKASRKDQRTGRRTAAGLSSSWAMISAIIIIMK